MPSFATDQWEGNLATFNEWKLNLRLNYVSNDFSIDWESRFMSETDQFAASAEAFAELEAQNLSVVADAIWYHDLSASYYYDKYTFSTGVRNLTDETPPYLSNNDDMNTINYSYDTAGRYLYAKVTAKF